MSRDLILVALSLLTWGIGEGMFFFFQPLYLQELGADSIAIGSILGLAGLAMMLAFLPAGYLSDRIGRRPLIRLAWLMGTVSTLLMAASQSLPIFVTGMVLYGATAFVTVPLNSYTTAARGRLGVSRTITLISAFYYVGFILGPILGGLIGEKRGLHANFQIAAVVFIVSTVIIFFIRPQPVESPSAGSSSTGVEVFKDPRYLRFVTLIFFIFFGLYLPQPLTPNFLQNERGIGLAVMGQLLAVRSTGIVVLNLVFGQLNARVGFILSQVGMGLFVLLIWLSNSLPFYMLGYFMMGSYITARGLTIAQSRTLIEARNMGLGYGLLETVMSLTVVLGPPLAGYLYSLNPEWIYLASLVLIGAGIIAYLVFSPLQREDLATFEEKEKAQWRPS